MGAEKLTGTAWHVEKIKKEFKRPCLFFRDEDHWCQKRNKQCFRSVRCEYYQPIYDDVPKEKKKKKKRFAQPAKIVIGSTVHHHEYGIGIVQSIKGPISIVRFVNVGLRTVYTDTCIPHKSVETIKNRSESRTTITPKALAKESAEGNEKQKVNHPVSEDVLAMYSPGCKVIHATYGTGIITHRVLGEITVDFEEYGVKRMTLDHCIRNRLISLARFPNVV